MEFLKAVKSLFPESNLTGADLYQPDLPAQIDFKQMDLTEDFTLPANEKFDVVSSISGVMMFSNTLRFVKNCVEKLEVGGKFILTNDNNATIRDRLAYLFLGRFRIFNLVFEDQELMTENVPVNELVRLMRTHNIQIDTIKYTSFYPVDILLSPIACMVYITQWLYLKLQKPQLPTTLVKQMYPFKQLLCRHYIIIGTKLK
ncbi:MAG: hypothetical protein EOP42_09070 [Sphingobacteriaceae bacterium]|nr:MAG: hypothetical protein EOP42_09070 [Sphingobacteriaceae bacterium]